MSHVIPCCLKKSFKMVDQGDLKKNNLCTLIIKKRFFSLLFWIHCVLVHWIVVPSNVVPYHPMSSIHRPFFVVFWHPTITTLLIGKMLCIE